MNFRQLLIVLLAGTFGALLGALKPVLTPIQILVLFTLFILYGIVQRP